MPGQNEDNSEKTDADAFISTSENLSDTDIVNNQEPSISDTSADTLSEKNIQKLPEESGDIDVKTVSEEDVIQNAADILDKLYSDKDSVSYLLTESDNTVISEIADSASESDENENTADQIDVHVMILTENMVAFSNDSNISDSINMQSGTDSLAFANQLLAGTQAS